MCLEISQLWKIKSHPDGRDLIFHGAQDGTWTHTPEGIRTSSVRVYHSTTWANKNKFCKKRDSHTETTNMRYFHKRNSLVFVWLSVFLVRITRTGAPSRVRTYNQRLRRPLLFQLSYGCMFPYIEILAEYSEDQRKCKCFSDLLGSKNGYPLLFISYRI